MFLSDNYPVNDNSTNAVHLTLLTGRDKDLFTVVDGYLLNPLGPQNEINRIPLFTIGDYANDPLHYDPKRSIRQAIEHQTDGKIKRQLLHFHNTSQIYTLLI